jgi:putative ABC transport system permease protein
VLVLGEVMLAVIAVIGASQMIRGFRAMSDVYQGFSPDRIFTARLALTPSYEGLRKRAAFFDRALAAVASVPGVESVTVSSNLPGALIFNPTGEIEIEGDRALSSAEAPLADLQIIGPQYFSTLKIPVRDGRGIEEQDGEATPLVAVVGQRLADRYWPGQSPVGKRIRLRGGSPEGWRTIVGVVGDVHQFWFQKDPRPLVYMPYRQAQVRSVYLTAAMRGDPIAATPAIQQKIREIDRAVPLSEPRIMRELMQETLSAMRLTAGMMMVFGVLALVLAAVGVYGVMAYSVTIR